MRPRKATQRSAAMWHEADQQNAMTTANPQHLSDAAHSTTSDSQCSTFATNTETHVSRASFQRASRSSNASCACSPRRESLGSLSGAQCFPPVFRRCPGEPPRLPPRCPSHALQWAFGEPPRLPPRCPSHAIQWVSIGVGSGGGISPQSSTLVDAAACIPWWTRLLAPGTLRPRLGPSPCA